MPAVVAVVVACAAAAPPGGEATDPIVHGVVDSGHPAVVAVEAPGWLCSGTLVAKRVVVTAGHCLPADPTDVRVFFGTDVAEGGHRLSVVDGMTHPDYDDAEPRNDIAVLRLKEDGPAPPMPMRREPLQASFVGKEITLVGFGIVSAEAEQAGRKRKTVSRVISISAREFSYGDTPGQTCHGDSGGPALLEEGGEEILVGVTSRGDETCTLVGVDTRVDAYVASFVQPFIDGEPTQPDPPVDPGCGDVTEIGLCRDNLLVYCDAGALVEVDCEPDTCTWDPLFGWYDCL